MINQIEEVVREYAVDFESKVVIANDLIALAEILKSEAVNEMSVLESKILATRQLLGDVVVETKEEVKPIIVTPEEIVEEKVYEAKNFEFENRVEAEGAKIQGSFTYNRKKFYFQASDNMSKPMVYGAKDMNVINACINAVMANVDDTFYDPDFKDYCGNVNNPDRYYNDMDREIMIYFAPDGSFKGYFQGKAFVWEKDKYEVPTYANYKNSLDTDKYRPMKNIGQADLIIKLCNELESKASYLNKKKEVAEEQQTYWDSKIEGNPEDWCEDVEW